MRIERFPAWKSHFIKDRHGIVSAHQTGRPPDHEWPEDGSSGIRRTREDLERIRRRVVEPVVAAQAQAGPQSAEGHGTRPARSAHRRWDSTHIRHFLCIPARNGSSRSSRSTRQRINRQRSPRS
jgi:hypothetical protein